MNTPWPPPHQEGHATTMSGWRRGRKKKTKTAESTGPYVLGRLPMLADLQLLSWARVSAREAGSPCATQRGPHHLNNPNLCPPSCSPVTDDLMKKA